jgi:hypothetical protein
MLPNAFEEVILHFGLLLVEIQSGSIDSIEGVSQVLGGLGYGFAHTPILNMSQNLVC